MIAMAAQWPDVPTTESVLWSLKFSNAKLREIASDHGLQHYQVDHLRRKFQVVKTKSAHRCPKCGSMIKTAECLRCHLEATHGN